MTAQVQDYIILDKSEYVLSSYELDDDAELFDPFAHGFQPVMMTTGCYRGYYCKYRFRYRRLCLEKITVRNAKGVPYPVLNGVAPEVGENGLDAVYTNLKMPLPVTGTLQIASDFMRELYRHMGYQELICYKTVKELHLKDGRLVATIDQSAEIEQMRQVQTDINTFVQHNWLPEEWNNRLKHGYGLIDRNDIERTFLRERKNLEANVVYAIMEEIRSLQPAPRWLLVNYGDYYERARSYHFTFQFLAYLGCPSTVIQKLKSLISPQNTESQVVVAFLEMLRTSLAGELWGETIQVITGKQYLLAGVLPELQHAVTTLFSTTTHDAWPAWV